MPSLSSLKMPGKKAQFFILSAIVIVGIVYFISKWSEPYTILDTSAAATGDDLFIFNNVKSKVFDIANMSKSCEDLTYNLDEYESFIGNYLLGKSKLYVTHSFESPCLSGQKIFPTIVLFNITMRSPEKTMSSMFKVFWPA